MERRPLEEVEEVSGPVASDSRSEGNFFAACGLIQFFLGACLISYGIIWRHLEATVGGGFFALIGMFTYLFVVHSRAERERRNLLERIAVATERCPEFDDEEEDEEDGEGDQGQKPADDDDSSGGGVMTDEMATTAWNNF